MKPLITVYAIALAAVGIGCGEPADARPSPTKAPAAPTVARNAVPDPVGRAPGEAPSAASTRPAPELPPGTADGPTDEVLPRFTGRTAASRESAVGAKGAGVIAEILVDEGQRVEAGDIIAKLDDTDARLRVHHARAAVKVAKVQARGARREAERIDGLKARDAVPQARVDAAHDQLAASEAQVSLVRAGLFQAMQALKDTTVKAPYAGYITMRLKSEGEWVSTMPPSPMVKLARLDPLEVRLEVPSEAMGRIAPGDRVTVEVPAIGRTVEATIARVIPTVGRNRAFTVVAELPNADGSLSAGLFVEAELVR